MPIARIGWHRADGEEEIETPIGDADAVPDVLRRELVFSEDLRIAEKHHVPGDDADRGPNGSSSFSMDKLTWDHHGVTRSGR